MSDKAKLIGGIFALIVAMGIGSGPSGPAADSASRPSSLPAVTTSLDLRQAFAAESVATADRRKHAADLRRVVEIVEDGLRWDAARPATDRAFTRVEQVDQFVVTVRTFLLREWSFAAQYPQLGPAIAGHLKSRFLRGSSGTLTDEVRGQWLAALAEIRTACSVVEAS